MIIEGRDAHCSSGSQRALLPIEIISVKQSMDNNNCGFQISSREIDILTSCEEDFGSRNSFTSLLNSAVPPGGPSDPPAAVATSLNQSLFDSIASYLDNINPRAAPLSHVELRKGACFRRGPGIDSQELHLEMENHSNNSSDNNISPPPPLSSSLNAEAVSEHFDPSQWSQAAQTSRGNNNNNNKNPTNGSVSGSVSASGGSRLSLDPASASKVGKKRSRASRRAPTTVLTTDTTNFRAMVQEFTGIPPAPFASPSPFQRNRGLDFLGPRSLSGNPFLLRPFPHRTQTFPSAVPPPPAPFQLPPPGLLFQSLLHHNPPKDSISLPNLLNKSGPCISEAHIKAGLFEDLGLNSNAAQALNNHVLPDLVPSDRRPAPAPHWSAEVPCKMPYNNSNRVGPDLGRAPTSNPEEGNAEPNNHHARADGIVDSWISSSDQTLDKLVQ